MFVSTESQIKEMCFSIIASWCYYSIGHDVKAEYYYEIMSISFTFYLRPKA